MDTYAQALGAYYTACNDRDTFATHWKSVEDRMRRAEIEPSTRDASVAIFRRWLAPKAAAAAAAVVVAQKHLAATKLSEQQLAFSRELLETEKQATGFARRYLGSEEELSVSRLELEATERQATGFARRYLESEQQLAMTTQLLAEAALQLAATKAELRSSKLELATAKMELDTSQQQLAEANLDISAKEFAGAADAVRIGRLKRRLSEALAQQPRRRAVVAGES